ncbi:Transposase [Caligus rogercresseyi]|uniref:Transposase n=1 Tax=Caligus rogercresseyi TaxID=217165 RepID=A0A7T8QWT2_CALRO|nr:Transposase [Caligus rogercresseyi]
MSSFVPTNYDLRTALLFCFHLKKTAVESHRIVSGDEKLIYFENPKRNKSWTKPLRAKDNSVCLVGLEGRNLLLAAETWGNCQYSTLPTTNDRFGSKYQQRQHKVILLHDNAPAHKAKQVQETIESLRWEILQHAVYSPDLAHSNYYLFASMGNALAEQRFTSYEDVRKWIDDWFASKEQQFFWRGIHKLPERWGKCIDSDGQYFE